MSEKDRIALVVGALLHDIGKVVYRAGMSAERHAKSGTEYLRSWAAGAKQSCHDPAPVSVPPCASRDTEKIVLDCVRYHHRNDLSDAGLENDSPAYIVYMADNIASAVDRREEDGGGKGFAKYVPLASIFNILNGNSRKGAYHPRMTNMEDGINYPIENAPDFDEGAYRKILADIGKNLEGVEWTADYVHSLLEVLESGLSFVPSSTSKGEVADISLFSHVKLTAAFAAAMEDYLEAEGEKDYKGRLFVRGQKFYEEKAFLLTTLDLSGIQKFIYTITSEGALKNLRARSFYLDFMMEHIASCILSELGMTRANLIYSGGGRADLILANTDKTRQTLKSFCQRVNAWFEDHFDIALYMAAGFASASAKDLRDEPKGSYGELQRLRSAHIADNKAHRYTAEEIIALNRRKFGDDTRECKMCKRADRLTKDDLCEICSALAKISQKIISDKYEYIAALPGENGELLPLPGNYSMVAGSEADARAWQNEGANLYGKNRFLTGKNVNAKLWVGDYNTGETFEELADQATGIKRLGVFRADVDNLGTAFAFGFRRGDGDSRYVTVSRTAELSRQLSLFFKLHIRKILANPGFTMTGKPKPRRHAAIVYSGGDDLFIVGAWDDIIELAIDIRRAFARFTENTLTLSAGIGIYKDSYPISVMADETAILEEKSKSCPGKNAVTLPSEGGSYIIIGEKGEKIELDEGTYAWDILEEKVIGEKLRALEDFFALTGNSAEQENERGKNFLYNLLELLRGHSEKVNLARYIYLLSRMEPKKSDDKDDKKENYRIFADKMYRWYQKDEDRRQLKTAILLYVYLTRERNEEDHAEQ